MVFTLVYSTTALGIAEYGPQKSPDAFWCTSPVYIYKGLKIWKDGLHWHTRTDITPKDPPLLKLTSCFYTQFLVNIHISIMSGNLLPFVLKYLPKHLHILCVDMPGHEGTTRTNKDDYSIQGQARRIRQVGLFKIWCLFSFWVFQIKSWLTYFCPINKPQKFINNNILFV